MTGNIALGLSFFWLLAICAFLAWKTGEWDFKRTNDALNNLPDENGTAGAGGADFINHGEGK